MDPAKLQKQLANLMKVVTKEQQLQQAAEAARQRAEVRLEARIAEAEEKAAKGPKLEAMYFDTEKKSRAEKAIRALQHTKSVAAYTHTFMIHAHDCGWEARTLQTIPFVGSRKRLSKILGIVF
ncbi:hypothetical protein PCASD_13772 [Puccinia coronata f. sp. avenae]|uniref:Uncharacterized protein n=1 Tax=Puccinia coronata f. sp. avenae TaxID=200324 RepID=A0A2N5UL85_9BASI|nr:hypothetical protein PCASD_13772 [Puccinia coronata f. sp. avenae]